MLNVFALLVLAMNRGENYYKIETAAADTGKDAQIILNRDTMGSKAERRAMIEQLLSKLDTEPEL